MCFFVVNTALPLPLHQPYRGSRDFLSFPCKIVSMRWKLREISDRRRRAVMRKHPRGLQKRHVTLQTRREESRATQNTLSSSGMEIRMTNIF